MNNLLSTWWLVVLFYKVKFVCRCKELNRELTLMMWVKDKELPFSLGCILTCGRLLEVICPYWLITNASSKFIFSLKERTQISKYLLIYPFSNDVSSIGNPHPIMGRQKRRKEKESRNPSPRETLRLSSLSEKGGRTKTVYRRKSLIQKEVDPTQIPSLFFFPTFSSPKE